MSSSVTVNELVKTPKIQYAFGEDYGSRLYILVSIPARLA